MQPSLNFDIVAYLKNLDNSHPNSDKENGRTRENELHTKSNGKLIQNYNAQVTSTSLGTDSALQETKQFTEDLELPAEFYPLVLLVAGLRPVKVPYDLNVN